MTVYEFIRYGFDHLALTAIKHLPPHPFGQNSLLSGTEFTSTKQSRPP
jgi:hypothetical protein